MQIHKYILDFEDENITKTIANGTSKSYIKSQRMINNKTIRKMHTYFHIWLQVITFNVHFQLSSDIIHFTLFYIIKSHVFVLNAKTFI